MQVSEGTNAMFAEPTPVQTKETPATLDPRILERTEMTEILEYVLRQIRDAHVVSGYSRMHHRHSRTSG